MDTLTRIAVFTAGFAFATSVPTNARANVKPYSNLKHAAATAESIAIRTDIALSDCSRQFKESKPSLANAACRAASYLRALGRFASYRGKAADCVKFAALRDPNLSPLSFTDAVLKWHGSAYVTEDTASTGGPIDLKVPVGRIKRLSAKPTLCRHGMNGLQAKRYVAIGNDPTHCHRDGSI